MNVRVNTQLIVISLLMLAVLMSFSIGFAQDESGDTSTETAGSDNTAQTADNTDVSAEPTDASTEEPAGVGEIAKAADNFNVPAILTPQDADRAVLALQQRFFKSPGDFMNEQNRLNFENEKFSIGSLLTVSQKIEQVKRILNGGSSKPKRMPVNQTPSGDILVQFTDDSSGDVLTLFTDYSVVMADAKGETFFEGNFGEDSSQSLIIVGHDTEGNQYAFSNGDVIGSTVGGDVFLGNGDHIYFYDYNDVGDFVGLTDGDGNEYAVETTDDGGFTITDVAGDVGDFNVDGSYDIKDPAGDVLDQGALYGENDDDPTLSLDASEDIGSLDENNSDAGSVDENSGDASTVGDNGAETDAPDANTGDTSSGENGSDG